MPRMVLKVSPDKDLYVEWSSIVEAPIKWGGRDDMVEMLYDDHLRHHGSNGAMAEVQARLDRADEFGTSAMYGHPRDGSWTDQGFIYKQRGWLPRERLEDLVVRINESVERGEGEDPDVMDLLVYFDE